MKAADIPDVIIELSSPTTAADDHGIKKGPIRRSFRTQDYFIYDPDTETCKAGVWGTMAATTSSAQREGLAVERATRFLARNLEGKYQGKERVYPGRPTDRTHNLSHQRRAGLGREDAGGSREGTSWHREAAGRSCGGRIGSPEETTGVIELVAEFAKSIQLAARCVLAGWRVSILRHLNTTCYQLKVSDDLQRRCELGSQRQAVMSSPSFFSPVTGDFPVHSLKKSRYENNRKRKRTPPASYSSGRIICP